MNSIRTLVIVCAVACILSDFAGCSTSSLVDVWSETSFRTPALNNMLVISVSRNAVQRRIWEDAFSIELEKHAVAATPSYRLFPDAVPDTLQVVQTVKSNNFDGVLIYRRLPSETKKEYVQGYVTVEQNVRFDRRRDRFVTYYRDIEHAGYVDSQVVALRGIDVWTTSNEGQMIWSATSKTPEPSSLQMVRPEIVELVMSELHDRGIIGPKR